MRTRATKEEMRERYEALRDIIEITAPTSVRHAYYAAITRHLIDKDTSETKRSNYGKVQRAILNMRRHGVVDYEAIVDETRWMRKPTSYTDIEDALAHWSSAYRRDLWARNGTLLEVWCESDSIAGVLQQVTERWDVPLFPCRGYSSETFAWGAARNWIGDYRDPTVLYVGDLDLYGKQIEIDLRRKLEGFYEEEVEWHRVGLTREQVEEHNLEGLATKEGHWEAEALPPEVMRSELEAWIQVFVSEDALAAHQAAEESERDVLSRMKATYSARRLSED